MDPVVVADAGKVLRERKFRWAVGEPAGRQSPPWTLTVRGPEFVLAARTPRQRWHVTFHPSGQRHWRFDTPGILARAGGPAGVRDADTWQAPDPVRGVVTEFTIIVPTTELRIPASTRLLKGVEWFAAVPFGDVVRIAIARQPLGSKSVVGVWSTPLGPDEEVVVAAVAGPLNAEEAAFLSTARKNLAGRSSDARSLADPGAFVWAHAGDRSRFWMVIAPP